MCIPCMAITVGIVIGAVCIAWLAVRLSDKLTKLRNRPVHDTETDGRIDDSGYGASKQNNEGQTQL